MRTTESTVVVKDNVVVTVWEAGKPVKTYHAHNTWGIAGLNALRNWFAGLGAAVADGGNPISRAWTVSTDGTTEDGGANPATGYSVLTADSMQAALEMAKGCPHLASGGSIELAETYNVGP